MIQDDRRLSFCLFLLTSLVLSAQYFTLYLLCDGSTVTFFRDLLMDFGFLWVGPLKTAKVDQLLLILTIQFFCLLKKVT